MEMLRKGNMSYGELPRFMLRYTRGAVVTPFQRWQRRHENVAGHANSAVESSAFDGCRRLAVACSPATSLRFNARVASRGVRRVLAILRQPARIERLFLERRVGSASPQPWLPHATDC